MSTFQQVGLHLDPARLRSLIAAGQSVVVEQELEGVLDRLVASSRELTGALHAEIKVLDDDGPADAARAASAATAVARARR